MTASPNKSPLRSVIPTPTLCVEHAVTADMDDGQPLPPLIEDGVAWHAVRRIDGRTTWRRISLANQTNAAIGAWGPTHGVHYVTSQYEPPSTGKHAND
jgi:hypothetical protein